MRYALYKPRTQEQFTFGELFLPDLAEHMEVVEVVNPDSKIDYPYPFKFVRLDASRRGSLMNGLKDVTSRLDSIDGEEDIRELADAIIEWAENEDIEHPDAVYIGRHEEHMQQFDTPVEQYEETGHIREFTQ